MQLWVAACSLPCTALKLMRHTTHRAPRMHVEGGQKIAAFQSICCTSYPQIRVQMESSLGALDMRYARPLHISVTDLQTLLREHPLTTGFCAGGKLTRSCGRTSSAPAAASGTSRKQRKGWRRWHQRGTMCRWRTGSPLCGPTPATPERLPGCAAMLDVYACLSDVGAVGASGPQYLYACCLCCCLVFGDSADLDNEEVAGVIFLMCLSWHACCLKISSVDITVSVQADCMT